MTVDLDPFILEEKQNKQNKTFFCYLHNSHSNNQPEWCNAYFWFCCPIAINSQTTPCQYIGTKSPSNVFN